MRLVFWFIGLVTIFSASNSIAQATGPAITSLSINQGPIKEGVVITGTQFGTRTGSSSVTINGTPQTIITWSTTTIQIQVATGTTSGNLIVHNALGSSGPVPFTITSYTCPSCAMLPTLSVSSNIPAAPEALASNDLSLLAHATVKQLGIRIRSEL